MTTPTLTRLLIPTLALALMMPGCGDSNTPAPNTGRTGPATADADTPNTDHHDGPSRDASPARVGDTTPNTDTTDPAPRNTESDANPDTEVSAGRVATVKGNARSPFPEAGERLTRHVSFTRLAEHDAFENPIDPEDIPEVVPWEEAGQYVGHTITVEGRIVNIGQTRDASVFFLNFHAEWRGKFYMVVFDDLAETLEGGVEGTFLNKLVRVEGLVEDHRGRPQIKIESMDQVEFVEE